MSENLSADPSAIRAHAMRLSSYQGDLEQASDALRAAAASTGAFGMMVGPIIAPLFQLVEAGEHLAISGAGLALDKLSQSLIASARSFETREASSSASLSQAGSGLDGGYRGN
jgi:hypothetical protein